MKVFLPAYDREELNSILLSEGEEEGEGEYDREYDRDDPEGGSSRLLEVMREA